MGKYSLKPLNISPAEFLGAFFHPKETICFRILPGKEGSAFSQQKLESVAENMQKTLPLLEEHNKQGRGILFVVNLGGHDGKNITRINAQFVDIDHGALDDQLAQIKAFPLETSLIVKTRRGLHCYWLMKNASIGRFSHIQKQLVKQFDGEPACVDLPRVLRVSGFYHHKEEPLLIECIKFNPELRSTQDQLAGHLPEVPEETLPGENNAEIRERGTQKGILLAWKRCTFFQHCRNRCGMR